MQDWNYYYTNDLDVTIEVGCNKIVDKADLSSYWKENKYALLSYLGQVT
jgi:carboxypeptidase D